MFRFALRKPMTAGLAVLAGLTLFRVIYIQIIPLAADEAYYWQWSRHLAWGYFDNGPLVGWVIRAGTLAFGDTALGIRIPAVIFSLGIGLLILDFCRRFLKDPVLGMFLTVLYNVAPIFGVGSVIMTYDTVQAFFWLLSVYLAAMAIFADRPRAWYGAGLAAGFSMLAKYSSGLLPLLLFAFLILMRRDQLSRKEPWLGAVLALLVLAPNMIWVAAHDFAPFRYNLGRTAGEWIFSLPDFAASQVGMAGPILFGLLIYGSRIALREARAGDAMHGLLLMTSWPVLLLFALLSIKTRVYGTWSGPAYLTMGLTAGLALRRLRPPPTSLPSWTWAGLIMGVIMVVIVFAHPLIIRAVNLPAPLDPTRELYGWDILGREIGAVLDERNDAPVVFGLRYQTASLAAFYTPGQPDAQCLFPPGERLNSYLYWHDPASWKGKNGIAVVYDPLPEKAAALFAETRLIKKLTLPNAAGQPAHRMALYDCRGFVGRDAREDRP